jgi:hypothetical protein
MVRTSSLSHHPLLDHLPPVDRSDATVRAVGRSILDLGEVIEPLKVNRGRVVDGRVRLMGAEFAGLEFVPVVEVTDEKASDYIVHSILARTHLPKGALAYRMAAVMEARENELWERLLNSKRDVSASTSALPSKVPATACEAAERLGVSAALMSQAKSARQKIAQLPAKMRTSWEARILSGEIGLGQALQALSGKLAAIEGQTTPIKDPERLLFDLFETAAIRLDRWGKLDEKQRGNIASKFRTEFLPLLPEELLAEVITYTVKDRIGELLISQAVLNKLRAALL